MTRDIFKKLKIAYITVNRKCNFHCPWCYAKDSLNFGPDMSWDLFQNIVNICKYSGIKTAVLIGGEPSIYPLINEAVSLLKDNSINPALITNGYAFRDKKIAKSLTERGLSEINISFKGSSRDEYSKISSCDGFDGFLSGIQNLISCGASITGSVTFTKSTLPGLENMLYLMIDSGCNNIIVEFGNPFIYNGKILTDDIPDPMEIAIACNEANEFLKNKPGIKYTISPGIPLCLLPEKLFEFLVTQKKLKTGCQMRSGNTVIFDPKGNIIPCNQFTQDPFARFNVDYKNFEDFSDIWKSKAHRDIITAANWLPVENCATCSKWTICGGGCIIKWMYFNPNEYIVAPGATERG